MDSHFKNFISRSQPVSIQAIPEWHGNEREKQRGKGHHISLEKVVSKLNFERRLSRWKMWVRSFEERVAFERACKAWNCCLVGRAFGDQEPEHENTECQAGNWNFSYSQKRTIWKSLGLEGMCLLQPKAGGMGTNGEAVAVLHLWGATAWTMMIGVTSRQWFTCQGRRVHKIWCMEKNVERATELILDFSFITPASWGIGWGARQWISFSLGHFECHVFE